MSERVIRNEENVVEGQREVLSDARLNRGRLF